MRSCSELTALPEGLFSGLAALTSVDLSFNKLTALPEGLFGGLAALTSVDLAYCTRLTALPEGLFSGLAALTSIDLSGSVDTTPEMLEDLRVRGVEVTY